MISQDTISAESTATGSSIGAVARDIRWFGLFRMGYMERFCETDQILWPHGHDTVTGGVEVRDEHECDRGAKR